ncbi:MAG: hypothetical protein D6722_11725, partial [Bacteroidetes bacterium]
MSSLVERYPFAHCPLAADESVVYLYSDGWTEALTYAVLRVKISGICPLETEYLTPTRQQVAWSYTEATPAGLEERLQAIFRDPQTMFTWQETYDFGFMDQPRCLLGFRFPDYPHLVRVQLNHPFYSPDVPAGQLPAEAKTLLELAMWLD